MPFYKIYAGLGGGFGGAFYCYTGEYKDTKEAEKDAYDEACEIFEGQLGSGMDGYEEFRIEAESYLDDSDFLDEDGEFDGDAWEQAIEAQANQIENDAKESWIDYHVVETDSIDDVNE